MTQLPFYPACSYERRNDISVWWFEKDFSQNSYGQNAERGRNACVLIVLLTAAKIAQRNIQLSSKDSTTPSQGLVIALAESMLEGIGTYSRLADANRLVAANLNIPEAYQALGRKVSMYVHEWKSFLYVVPMAGNLANFIQEGLHKWRFMSSARKNFLFVTLIADTRAVLIVLDQVTKTATFIDSHPHSQTHGSCIAQTDISNIKELCKWISKVYLDLYNSRPECFELAYFQVKQRSN